MKPKRVSLSQVLLTLFAGVLVLFAGMPAAGAEWACQPTRPDMLGPMYKPDAPVRSSVGTGYLLSGAVRSAADCSPIPGARIELWLTGVSGRYDDDHRATVLADTAGGYRFESNFPPPYARRPSHIHLRVTADGFQTLVTQHYPTAGTTAATFDLVLIPR
jgi:protocatechuate 3,4-dioxygenase beta subunit